MLLKYLKRHLQNAKRISHSTGKIRDTFHTCEISLKDDLFVRIFRTFLSFHRSMKIVKQYLFAGRWRKNRKTFKQIALDPNCRVWPHDMFCMSFVKEVKRVAFWHEPWQRASSGTSAQALFGNKFWYFRWRHPWVLRSGYFKFISGVTPD